MTTAVFDTNVVLQALIGRPESASVRALRAIDDGRAQLAFCQSTIDELLDVLALPRMRDLHQLTDTQIVKFVESLLPDAILLPDPVFPPASLARDVTDGKFLGLAEAADAAFIVTNDRRHLLRLRLHGGIPIVTPAAFLNRLE